MKNKQTTADGWEIIDVYTRAQAIEDGVLIECPDALRQEAGIKFHVAFTTSVWDIIDRTAKKNKETHDWVMWDIFTMFKFYLQNEIKHNRNSNILLFKVNFRGKDKILKSIIGPGDNAEPVITILLPEED